MTNDLRNEIVNLLELTSKTGSTSEAIADAILAKLDTDAEAPDPDALIVAALEAAAVHAEPGARNDIYSKARNDAAAAIRAKAADPEARAAIKAKAGWSE